MAASTRDKQDMRRQTIPIIYVRGTHYEVGFDVVRLKDPKTYQIITFNLHSRVEHLQR